MRRLKIPHQARTAYRVKPLRETEQTAVRKMPEHSAESRQRVKVQKVRQKPDRLHQQKQVLHRQRLQKTHRRKMPEFRNMMRQENRSMQKRRRAKKTAAPAFLSEWVL